MPEEAITHQTNVIENENEVVIMLPRVFLLSFAQRGSLPSTCWFPTSSDSDSADWGGPLVC